MSYDFEALTALEHCLANELFLLSLCRFQIVFRAFLFALCLGAMQSTCQSARMEHPTVLGTTFIG